MFSAGKLGKSKTKWYSRTNEVQAVECSVDCATLWEPLRFPPRSDDVNVFFLLYLLLISILFSSVFLCAYACMDDFSLLRAEAIMLFYFLWLFLVLFFHHTSFCALVWVEQGATRWEKEVMGFPVSFLRLLFVCFYR